MRAGQESLGKWHHNTAVDLISRELKILTAFHYLHNYPAPFPKHNYPQTPSTKTFITQGTSQFMLRVEILTHVASCLFISTEFFYKFIQFLFSLIQYFILTCHPIIQAFSFISIFTAMKQKHANDFKYITIFIEVILRTCS